MGDARSTNSAADTDRSLRRSRADEIRQRSRDRYHRPQLLPYRPIRLQQMTTGNGRRTIAMATEPPKHASTSLIIFGVVAADRVTLSCPREAAVIDCAWAAWPLAGVRVSTAGAERADSSQRRRHGNVLAKPLPMKDNSRQSSESSSPRLLTLHPSDCPCDRSDGSKAAELMITRPECAVCHPPTSSAPVSRT